MSSEISAGLTGDSDYDGDALSELSLRSAVPEDIFCKLMCITTAADFAVNTSMLLKVFLSRCPVLVLLGKSTKNHVVDDWYFTL